MTYEDAVGELGNALRFGIHASLSGIQALVGELGRPQDAFASIQVTGTNGKTSTARFLASTLMAHGVSTGLYTSPHLTSYTERIEVNGMPVSEEDFARSVAVALEAAERTGGGFTEFELLTAGALWLFRELGVDVAVLEVGMGGRWDATSVVAPSVSVITGVGLDHTDRLGTTVHAIAWDKAHIIRPGSSVVLGPGIGTVADVFLERAESFDLHPRAVVEGDTPSPVFDDLTVRFRITRRPDGPRGETRLDIGGVHGSYEGIGFKGPSYQAPNIATAVAAAESALGRALTPERVRAAVRATRIPGRFEVLRPEPPLILDGAHNPQAAAVLANSISEAFGARQPFVVLGVLADKDAEGMVRALAPHVAGFVCAQAASPRAMRPDALADVVACVTGTRPDAVEDVTAAVVLADHLSAGCGVVVTGSLYALGEVRQALAERMRARPAFGE